MQYTSEWLAASVVQNIASAIVPRRTEEEEGERRGNARDDTRSLDDGMPALAAPAPGPSTTSLCGDFRQRR